MTSLPELLPWGVVDLPFGRVRVLVEDYADLLTGWLGKKFHISSDESAAFTHELVLSIGGKSALLGWPQFLVPGSRPGLTAVHRGDSPLLAMNLGTKAALQVEAGRSLVCLNPLQEVDPGHPRLQPSVERMLSGIMGDWMAFMSRQKFCLLHASANLVGGQAMVFLGESGAGKSTLGKFLAQGGYARVSDDLFPLGLEGAACVASPEPGMEAAPPVVGGLFFIRRGKQLGVFPLSPKEKHEVFFKQRWGARVLAPEDSLSQLSFLMGLPLMGLEIPEGMGVKAAEVAELCQKAASEEKIN